MKKYIVNILKYGGIGLGFLIVLITALILTYRGKSQPEVVSHSQPVTLSAAALTKTLVRTIQSQSPSLAVSASPDQANGIGYTVPGHDFFILLPVTTTSSTLQNTKNEGQSATYDRFQSVLPNIGTFFTEQGYNVVQSAGQTASFLTSVQFYQDKDTLCQVTAYRLLDITCIPRSQLQTAAQQLDPLVALYRSAAPNAGTPTVAYPVIRASLTPGYTMATVNIHSSVGETAVNFYQVAAGQWHMVNLLWYNDPHQNANITPNCEYFESDKDVRAAYQGQTCYDSLTRIARTIR